MSSYCNPRILIPAAIDTCLPPAVPPRRLSVYTEQEVVARSVVGPFTAGETLRLTCRATGGSPPPSVIWLEGEAYLDVVSEVRTPDLVANRLEVPALTRRDLHRTLTCRASNTNMTAPLITSVTLDMTCEWRRHVSFQYCWLVCCIVLICGVGFHI